MRIPRPRFTVRRMMVAATTATFATISLVWWAGSRQSDLHRYQSAIREIRGASPLLLPSLAKKYDCVIEPGEPLRVAFRQPGGISDNWVGIVYDPTGSVLQARRFKPDWSNWNDPALGDVKRLFGGDLRWAEPLGGAWYRCNFT